jgi:hypothetical protein
MTTKVPVSSESSGESIAVTRCRQSPNRSVNPQYGIGSLVPGTSTINQKRTNVEPGQSLSIPRGANEGFICVNRDAKILGETDSAAMVPHYCFEPFEGKDSEFGGELARF